MTHVLFLTLLNAVVVASAPVRIDAWAQQSLDFVEDTIETKVLRAASAPLFAGNDLLAFTVEAPFSTIFKDRSQESEEFAGRVLLDGGETALDVKIRTRGNFRLRASTCEFPPLRLNFKKRSVGGTVFELQDKLKLVTHCQTSRDYYQQYVIQEYLTYKAYGLLTDLSFRVRLAWVTYVDTESDAEPITRYAFLLEDDDMVAMRNRFEVLDVPSVSPNDFEPHQLAMVEFFQYMIGNVDWSAFKRERDRDTCCHNVKVIGTQDGLVLFPLPYDFDFSGIVNARYARVPEGLPIASPRNRLFRGRCVSLDYLGYVRDEFNARRETILDLYRQSPVLDDGQRADSLGYLEEFYDIINDDAKARREFRAKCRDI